MISHWLRKAYQQLSSSDVRGSTDDARMLYEMMKAKYKRVTGYDYRDSLSRDKGVKCH